LNFSFVAAVSSEEEDTYLTGCSPQILLLILASLIRYCTALVHSLSLLAKLQSVLMGSYSITKLFQYLFRSLCLVCTCVSIVMGYNGIVMEALSCS